MKKFKNNHGFTLVEMLIVLMIISVLIILIVPNLSGQSSAINEKGCDALTSMVQAQVDAYYIENYNYPEDLDVLVQGNYITDEQKVCPNGKTLTLTDGKVDNPSDKES